MEEVAEEIEDVVEEVAVNLNIGFEGWRDNTGEKDLVNKCLEGKLDAGWEAGRARPRPTDGNKTGNSERLNSSKWKPRKKGDRTYGK